MHRGTRVIRWFDRRTEREAGCVTLRSVRLPALRRAFGVEARDPMYMCYPIGRAQLDTVQPLVPHRMDLEQFDYFLEFDAQRVHRAAHAQAHRMSRAG